MSRELQFARPSGRVDLDAPSWNDFVKLCGVRPGRTVLLRRGEPRTSVRATRVAQAQACGSSAPSCVEKVQSFCVSAQSGLRRRFFYRPEACSNVAGGKRSAATGQPSPRENRPCRGRLGSTWHTSKTSLSGSNRKLAVSQSVLICVICGSLSYWIARKPWASLRFAHGCFRLAFQAARLFGGCLPTILTPALAVGPWPRGRSCRKPSGRGSWRWSRQRAPEPVLISRITGRSVLDLQ